MNEIIQNKIKKMIEEADKQAEICSSVEYDCGFYTGKGEALEEVLSLLESIKTNVIEDAIGYCTKNNLRALKSKEYLEQIIAENNIKAEWKSNKEFVLIDLNYGYELIFNKGGICRGCRGKEFQ